MSKAKELLEQLDNLYPLSKEEVVYSLQDKLNELGIENVLVDDIHIEPEGEIIVTFSDDEGDSVDVLFGIDIEEGPYAMVVSEDDEPVMIDLSPLSPRIVSSQLGFYVDLVDLSWMNLSTIKTLLQAGDVGPNEAMDEVVYRKVIRQGKVVKIPVVKRKKKLTLAQKRALEKARRKAHTAQAKRKRALSLKIRKQKGLSKEEDMNKAKEILSDIQAVNESKNPLEKLVDYLVKVEEIFTDNKVSRLFDKAIDHYRGKEEAELIEQYKDDYDAISLNLADLVSGLENVLEGEF